MRFPVMPRESVVVLKVRINNQAWSTNAHLESRTRMAGRRAQLGVGGGGELSHRNWGQQKHRGRRGNPGQWTSRQPQIGVPGCISSQEDSRSRTKRTYSGKKAKEGLSSRSVWGRDLSQC